MKPQCPLLKSDGSAQAKQSVSQGKSNEGQAPRTGTQASNQGEVAALEQRMKKQMEEMEKRMLQAISGLAAPRQNFNGQKTGQAKAVRTSADEDAPDDNVSVMQEPECNIMSEVQEPRQDHLKILKLADK